MGQFHCGPQGARRAHAPEHLSNPYPVPPYVPIDPEMAAALRMAEEDHVPYTLPPPPSYDTPSVPSFTMPFFQHGWSIYETPEPLPQPQTATLPPPPPLELVSEAPARRGVEATAPPVASAPPIPAATGAGEETDTSVPFRPAPFGPPSTMSYAEALRLPEWIAPAQQYTSTERLIRKRGARGKWHFPDCFHARSFARHDHLYESRPLHEALRSCNLCTHCYKTLVKRNADALSGR